MSVLNPAMNSFGMGLGMTLRREREERVVEKTVTCAEFQSMTLNQMLYRVLVEEK